MNKIFLTFLVLFPFSFLSQTIDTLKGLQNKEFVLNDENGKLRFKGNFSNGLRNGSWEIHEREDVFCEYKNGVLNGPYKVMDNGKLIHKWNYKNGKRSGEQSDYNGSDKPVEVYEMSNNQYHGTFKKFDYNGELTLEAEYKNGKRHGKTIQYLSGKKKLEIEYKNGSPNGAYTEYNSSNEIKEQGQMLNGKRDGKWNIYDDGKIENVVTYKDGVIVSNQPVKSDK